MPKIALVMSSTKPVPHDHLLEPLVIDLAMCPSLARLVPFDFPGAREATSAYEILESEIWLVIVFRKVAFPAEVCDTFLKRPRRFMIARFMQ